MSKTAVLVYKLNCIDKFCDLIDDYNPKITKKSNIKIFLLGFNDENEYNDLGDILNNLSRYDYKKNKNYFIQGSNYGYYSNLIDINNDPLDIFSEIIFMIIGYENYLKIIYTDENITDEEFIEKHLQNIIDFTNKIIVQICYAIMWNPEYRKLVLTNLGIYKQTFFSELLEIFQLLQINETTTQEELNYKIMNSINFANSDNDSEKKYNLIYEFIKDVLVEKFELDTTNEYLRGYIIKLLKTFNIFVSESLKSKILKINNLDAFNDTDLKELKFIEYKFHGIKFIFHDTKLLHEFTIKYCRELKKKKLLYQLLSTITNNNRDTIIIVNTQLLLTLREVLYVFYKNVGIIDYIVPEEIKELSTKKIIGLINYTDFLRYIKKEYCNVCYKPTGKCCPLCKITYYCGKECQKKDFKNHKQFCKCK